MSKGATTTLTWEVESLREPQRNPSWQVTLTVGELSFVFTPFEVNGDFLAFHALTSCCKQRVRKQHFYNKVYWICTGCGTWLAETSWAMGFHRRRQASADERTWYLDRDSNSTLERFLSEEPLLGILAYDELAEGVAKLMGLVDSKLQATLKDSRASLSFSRQGPILVDACHETWGVEP